MSTIRAVDDLSALPASGPGGMSTIEWMRVQSGLWVGKIAGEFAGMIESRGPQFVAIRLSQEIGTYDTLSDAKRSFA
ncbi:hypothetical protein M2152_002167 [Microbacteriaceae bacterium SG_E_30_P1]|uniref:Uncharacterized protein n=1 Tax=Antiquaquibacter oligotrophicus TaxID=2880260 RepID=A0ABT6KPS0_9MICO|nr:hypothetical protein [Antiquaquibacter oligotrophicus]MDH6181985.1 hypothetical protein [Antiquaquibacter oligotrophicus]UDF12346.1 hypothetical protein LH407_09250 [Antiquaquibacter oligotrophicus]